MNKTLKISSVPTVKKMLDRETKEYQRTKKDLGALKIRLEKSQSLLVSLKNKKLILGNERNVIIE